jgi:hypothetical protein
MIAFLLALVLDGQAGQLAGVTLPDSATVGGQALVLNGLGLREKLMIDVYVGGLYLPAKTSDATAAINNDVPKRIVMHFIYHEVTAEQLKEAFVGDLGKIAGGSAQAANMEKLCSLLPDVATGDEIAFDYLPGEGTTVTVKGSKKGSIAGADFMKVLWSIYLGSNPPTAALKAGLLGKG